MFNKSRVIPDTLFKTSATLVTFIGFLGFCGCGTQGQAPKQQGSGIAAPVTILADGKTLELDPSLPDSQSTLLKSDLARVADLGALTTLGQDADTWLRSRVRFILNQSHKVDGRILGDQEYKPTLLNSETDPDSYEIMANIGAALYSAAKTKKVKVAFEVMGHSIQIVSPRVGIIRVGPRLFSNLKGEDYSFNKDTGGSYLRIASLMHEARHSDGNGENVGFPHSVCPDSKTHAAGRPICDSASNGAYATEAKVLKEFKDRCTDCSEQMKAIIDTRITEALYRVINDSTAAKKDPTPEKIE